jgi:Fe-S oxidoreductase/CheY-like chemotaxis protein
MNRQAVISFGVCVHCGNCAESCHYYMATKDPKMSPAYKADRVRKLYKKYFDWTGRLLPRWVGAGDINGDDDLQELKDICFGSCTMCRRCTFNCPMGVDKALIIRTARGILTSLGLAPQGVIDVSKDQWETGNQMGVTDEDYLETIEWLSEELRNELGDQTAQLPMDVPNCNLVYAINPREVKYAPMSLLAAAKIFYTVGESWTLPAKGWDNTNFGLFSGDNALGGHMGKLVFENVQRLNANMLVTSECGHGYRATRWESPNWSGIIMRQPIVNFLELVVQYVVSGRLKLDPTRNAEPVTYHDPCNYARSGGITEEPRFLLKKSVMDFREMHPNRADNWCCSGGGGAMSMSEYSKRRLEVAKIKADQLKATGAKIVSTACHNCVDALVDLIRKYKLDMKVSLVGELVANATIVERKPAIMIPAAAEDSFLRGYEILVVDDEPDMVAFLSAMLEDNGVTVRKASNGNEALALLRKQKPHMMTLDLSMPGKSGVEVFEELRQDKFLQDVPVFIITGQPEMRKLIYDNNYMPPNGYADKPIDEEKFLLTVRKILNLPHHTGQAI